MALCGAPCTSLLFVVYQLSLRLSLYSLAQSICFCFDLPHIPHTSSLPALSISTFFPPQASRGIPLPPCLISSAAPTLVNLLKAREEPAKSANVPGLPSGDPAEFCLLLLAFGQAIAASGLTGSACSGCSGWMNDRPEENLGTGRAICLHVCMCTHVHCYSVAALALFAGFHILFIAKFSFSCYPPEGASSSWVSSQNLLESPQTFLHVTLPVQE